MTNFIRTMWHHSATQPLQSATATMHPIDQIQLPPSARATGPSTMEFHQRIKLERPASPCMSSSASDSDSGKAQRGARENARRDKRKPLDTDGGLANTSKKLKTEVALDPSGEERLRAMEAQLENLDPDSKESKKKRRLIRNRMSAQLHRERKKAYVGQLEDQLQAKERELKALQEQLAVMAVESQQLKQQLNRTERCGNPELRIKTEPGSLESAPGGTDEAVVDWAACLDDVDDAISGEDLLCDLDESPLTLYGLNSVSGDAVTTALAEEEQRQKMRAQTQSHHEIHAAKKNLAMMMAMMFSVTFCGHHKSVATVLHGSHFSSMFTAGPVKEMSQMSIASRIVACLEKTSWEDFQDVSSWTTSAASAVAAAAAVRADKKARARQAASPSAASDVTDTGLCSSPQELEEVDRTFKTDLMDEVGYAVDGPFASALAASNWCEAARDDFGQSDAENDDDRVQTTVKPVPMTLQLYAKLTKLWKEKNQVLATVLNGKNEVTRRSVADMSAIRKGMTTGALVPITATTGAALSKNLPLEKHDRSVTFLYPLSAFSEDQRSAAIPHCASSDHVFLEVSCQIGSAIHTVQ